MYGLFAYWLALINVDITIYYSSNTTNFLMVNFINILMKFWSPWVEKEAQWRTMTSETVGPIDWSHPPPSWAEGCLVHSIYRCSSATAGIRPCNLATFSMRGNHLAYAATQGKVAAPRMVCGQPHHSWHSNQLSRFVAL